MTRPRTSMSSGRAWTWLGLTTAGLAAVAFAAPSAAAVTPAGAHRISAISAHGLRERLSFVSGDHGWLLYTTSPVNDIGFVSSHLDDRLFARSRSGSRQRLPLLGRSANPEVIGYDIVGSTVSALGATGAALDPSMKPVTVWNLATRQHSVWEIPSTSWYIGTAPGGFFFTAGEGSDGGLVVDEMTSAGTAVSIGEPFPGYDPLTDGDGLNISVVSDHDTAVFSTSDSSSVNGDIAAYDYAKDTFLGLNSDFDDTSCTAVQGSHVACFAFNDEDSHLDFSDVLLSLHNGPSRVVHSTFPRPALSAAGMSWVARHKFETMSFAGKRHVATMHVDFADAIALRYDPGAEIPPVTMSAAYGGLAVTRDSLRTVWTTKGATHSFHRLFTAGRSSSAVGPFALGGNRVAWRDDTGRAGAQLVHVGDITDGQLTHRATIGSPTPSGSALDVSKSVLAFTATRHGVSGLRIVSRRHPTFLAHATAPARNVSGHRVIYYTTTKHSLVDAHVYDTRTGRSVTVGPPLLSAQDANAVAISGTRVAYEKMNASIWVEDLTTRHTTKVRPAGGDPLGSSVYIRGNEVAWLVSNHSQYRNVATMTPATSLSPQTQDIVGLSSRGVVTVNELTGEYSVTAYGTTSSGPPILSGKVSAPLLGTGSIIWTNTSGALEAAAQS